MVTIDNGYSISSSKILFGHDTVKIEYGVNSHSEIFGDFNDGYSNYASEEEEHTIWYVFKMTVNGIIFDYWGGAG